MSEASVLTRAGGGDPPDDEVRTRWQPTRAGLVNVWRYADEVLRFHRGRVLLRGPNGSGKSMALELLLPFLLDANAAPHRMSSAQKSRGGLYERMVAGATDQTGRVGFLWLELRRRDASGDVVTLTIGVRLRASASTRQVDKLWFVTPQQVGVDLHLLDADRVPLAAAALNEALTAGDGTTYDDAAAYRSRVREQLFPGFSEDQYDAVISALLALRQEKLSQNLDLERLSATLTSALPPLDPRDVADAAEGFRQLDQRRDNLEQLQDDVSTVGQVARRQARYARTLLRAGATDLITAQTARDNVVRTARETADALDDARTEEATVVAERAEIATHAAELRGRLDALRQRDAYKAGATIAALRAEVGRSEQARVAADERAGRARVAADRREEEADDADGDVQTAGQQVVAAWRELAAIADELGAAAPADAAAAAEPDTAEPLLAAWVDGRRTQVAEVRTARVGLDAAIRTRDELQARVEDATEVAEHRRAEHAELVAALDSAITELRAALGRWLASLRYLGQHLGQEVTDASTPDLGQHLGQGVTDTGTPDLGRLVEVDADRLGELVPRVEVAATRVRDRLAAATGRLDERDRELAATQHEVQGARDLLAAADQPLLEGPAWRRDRGGLAGAPLWQLVDFRDDLGEDERDRLESALRASGLLDAWVDPAGAVTLTDDDGAPIGDVLALGGAADGRGPRGDDLTAVLEPEPGGPVADELVTRVLASVGLADRAVVSGVPGSAMPGSAVSGPDVAGTDVGAVIGRDGSFRMAALGGAAPIWPAGYIGATARQRQRQRDLDALDVRLEQLVSARADLDQQRAAIVVQRADVDAEVAALPPATDAAQAREAVVVATQRASDADAAVRRAEDGLREAETAVRTAQRALHAAAGRHGLPTDDAGLTAIVDLLHGLEKRTGAWVSRRRLHAGAQARWRDRVAAAALALDAADEATSEATEAGARYADVRGRLVALEETAGAAYREVVGLIESAERELRGGTTRDAELQRHEHDLAKRTGTLEERLLTVEAQRDEADASRDRAAGRLGSLVSDGVVSDARIDLDAVAEQTAATVTAALELARELNRELADVESDERVVGNAQQRVTEAVHDAAERLAGRVDITFTQATEGWWLLRARAAGLERRISQLATSLGHDLDVARVELADHERDLYDRTLTEGLRRHLVARIREASELTHRINLELERVRTAAGVGVQLAWVVDDAPGNALVAQVRPLLLKAPEDLTTAEIAQLHAFLRARIDAVRLDEDDATMSWEGRLGAAFDYRRWHRFGLKVSHRAWEDEFRPATSRRLAQLSTGERSVVLHLPMLASVAAHYDATGTGVVGSPRLILLDELFVGVDPVNRAQLFSMFVTWDLDAVLTSDHEWCRYRELDGIAIHQVHGDADPVVTTRFVWDGHEQTVDASDGTT